MQAKTLLLSLGLLAGSIGTSRAQVPDSALAVHKLFHQRRGSGYGWAATGLRMAFDEGVGWQSVDRPTKDKVTAAAFWGGVPFVLGIRQALRFSAEREATIVAQYAQGRPIPADVRRKLRRKHFHLTARDIGPPQLQAARTLAN